MTMMCPFFRSRMNGKTALMMFTFAKKLISKISSTRLLVRLVCASSSTDPITAVHMQCQSHLIKQGRVTTFARSAQQHVDAPECLDSFSNSCLTLANHPTKQNRQHAQRPTNEYRYQILTYYPTQPPSNARATGPFPSHPPKTSENPHSAPLFSQTPAA